jgi:hypothetical protein
MAETEDLKSFQYRFESDRGHVEIHPKEVSLNRFVRLPMRLKLAK